MGLKGNSRFGAVAPCAAVLTLLSAASDAREISFNRDVRPILSDRCFACHGPDEKERKADLRLDVADSPDGAYRTHEEVTAIVPGSLDKSELWYRITTDDEDEVMPPPKSHKKPLSLAEREVIKAWIEAGAKYEDFWAFVAPTDPGEAEVEDSGWSADRIDRWVLEKMEQAGVKPSPDADKRTLIRRVTFDLTGLPPTRDEVRAFLADESPDAWEKLVDRLLASSSYGEHMARYWMDLVRFADTNGMHKDFYRNNVAYRDWVIRAFNENLGYDDFVRYQLAGDLFENPSGDQLAASGFHRLHLIIDRGTALPEESFFKNVLDRTTAVGTAFMGMTVNCATCHDHKYDPLTQKDFYSLFAFFNNIDAQPETNGGERGGLQPPLARIPSPEQQQRLRELEKEIARIEAGGGDPAEAERERQEIFGRAPQAMVMKERSEVRPTFLMKRGNYEMPGEEVTRNTPSFLPPLRKAGEVASRMDLANWFVAPENPLTARVAVNRFWQQLFGVGLVKTSEDLGAQGDVPSHPELLDHLTVSFTGSGWDIKKLLKAMVMSRTYRQSSVAGAEQFNADPENRLLARGSRYRMDAEMIRDQILATSGLLIDTMYGQSVKPPQPDGLWRAVTMIGERFKADQGDAIYRRSLYTYWKRGMPPPQMTILNAPIRDACTARRERTNTPSQALLLLNEAEYLKAARTLAQKALTPESASPAQQLAFIYETITSQLPDAGERAILGELVTSLRATYAENPALADQLCAGLNIPDASKKAELAAWTVLTNTIYNMDVTKTRQ